MFRNNSGAAVARTKAMELANGEYMAFLDSDDIWPEEKLKKQLAFMKKHDVAFSCTAYEQIDENGKSLNKIIKTVPKADYNRVLLDCPVGNSTVMYNVERWENLKYLILETKRWCFVASNVKKRKVHLWYEIGAYEISNKTEFYFK